MIYVFPLTARYENTVRATFRNALLLTVGRFPYTLLMVAVAVIAVIASLWNSVDTDVRHSALVPDRRFAAGVDQFLHFVESVQRVWR